MSEGKQNIFALRSWITRMASEKPRRNRTPSAKAFENAALDISNLEIDEETPSTSTGRRKSLRSHQLQKKDDEVPLDFLCGGPLDSDDGLEVEKQGRDAHGGESYGVRTPKKTPRKSDVKTPSYVRAKIKEEINKKVLESDEEEADFSPDESEYEPSNSASSADEASEEEEEPLPQKKIEPPPAPSTSRKSQRTQPKDLVLESDNYFSNYATGTAKTTSNNTLDRLKTPRLPQDKLFEVLSELKLSDQHEKAIQDLIEEHRKEFEKWMLLLSEGFSIIIYGFGSKKCLLEDFRTTYLKDYTSIVVNGFFPSLTLKDILDPILRLLEVSFTSSNPMEVVAKIEEEMAKHRASHLFLIVNNLDGTMLRNERAQTALSRLASVPNIHLVCSIDHINAGLLWDNTMLVSYNFAWYDMTTMLPYTEETAFETSLLVKNTGTLALSSMKSVFQSLTSNGRQIFLIIVKSQVNNKGNASYSGITFKDLYEKSKDAFLVSSDMALRAQLTEFLDHKLVKSKRTGDGEYLNIPLDYSLLKEFLEEHDK